MYLEGELLADYERDLENQEEECRTVDCEACKGAGGYDASTDCEIYDDWHDCPMCDGTGQVEADQNDVDEFVPGRDALGRND